MQSNKHLSKRTYNHTVEAEVDLKNQLLSMTDPDPTAALNQPAMAALAQLDAFMANAQFSDEQIKTDLLKLKPPFALLNQYLLPASQAFNQQNIKQQPLYAMIEMLNNIHKRIVNAPQLLSILSKLKQCYKKFIEDFCALTTKEQQALLQPRIYLRSTKTSTIGWRVVKTSEVANYLPPELEVERWRAEIHHYLKQKIGDNTNLIYASLRQIQPFKDFLIWHDDHKALKKLTTDHSLFANVKLRIGELNEMIATWREIPYRQLPVELYPYANKFEQTNDPLTNVLHAFIQYYQTQIKITCELSYKKLLSLLTSNSGHHVVSACHDIHFKFYCNNSTSIEKDTTDAPWIEQAVNALNRSLNQQVTTPAELLVMEMDGIRFHVLASKTIPGEDLDKLLMNTPHVIHQLDHENYTKQLFLNFIINHKDGKSDNTRGTLQEENGTSSLYLTGFDTNDCLGPPFFKLNNKIYSGMRQILFGLDQIEKPFAATFGKLLVTNIDLTPECFVLTWLTELYALNAFYQQLLDEGLLYVHEYQALNLPIRLQPETVADIYRKVKLIHIELQKTFTQTDMTFPTLDDLFKIIDPIHQRVYQLLRHRHQSQPIDQKLKNIWDDIRKSIDDLLPEKIMAFNEKGQLVEETKDDFKKTLPQGLRANENKSLSIEQLLVTWLATIDFLSLSHAAQIRFFSILKDTHPKFELKQLTLKHIDWRELAGLLFTFPLQSLTLIGWQDAGLNTLLNEKMLQRIKELNLELIIVAHDGLTTQSWMRLMQCNANIKIQLTFGYVLDIQLDDPLLWLKASIYEAPETILHFLWENGALQTAFNHLENLNLQPDKLLLLCTHWLEWQSNSQKPIDAFFTENIGKALQVFLTTQQTDHLEQLIQQLIVYLKKQPHDIFPITAHEMFIHFDFALAKDPEKLLILETIGTYFRLDDKKLSLPLTPIQSSALLHKTIIEKKIGAAILLLHANASTSYVDEANQTALHIFARHSFNYATQEAVSLCQLLLSFSDTEINRYDQRGYTPILYLLSLCEEMPDKAEILLSAFIKQGANLNIADFITGETILDKAINRNALKAFALLVHQGASSVKNIDAALKWIAMNFSDERKTALLDQLQQKNPAIHWQITLQTVMSVTPSTNAKPITGAYSGKRYLSSTLKSHAVSYGRHTTAILSQGDHKIFIKDNPELPGIEIAVTLLTHMLFKDGMRYTPHSELFRADQNGKPHPLLISQVVEGTSLQEVLQSSNWKEQLAQLDPECFSDMLFRSLLVLLEDGIPTNFKIVPFINDKGKKSYHLANIDNDHAFVEPLKINKQGDTELQVICIIWCLDQMKNKIDPAARERFLKHNPVAFLKQWLNTLADVEQQHFALFNRQKDREVLLFKQKVNRETAINIPIQPHLAKLYLSLSRIYHALNKYPDLTGLQLLGHVIPQLNQSHQEAFALDNKTPLERLAFIQKKLNKALHEIHPQEYQTLASTTKILEMQGLPLKEMVKEQNAYGPKAAMLDLENLAKEMERFIEIKQALVAGNLQPFNTIVHDGLREKILAGFDFKVLDKLSQRELIKALKKGGFHRLHIRGCSELTNNDLEVILKTSPGLTALTLSDCEQITNECLTFISTYGLCLKSLEMIQLKIDNIVITLPALQRLNFIQCENLSIVNIKAPLLQKLQIKYCHKLSIIHADSLQLASLNVYHCNYFNLANLFAIVHDVVCLEELIIKHCPRLVIPHFILQYPFLLNKHYFNLSINLLAEICKKLEGIANIDLSVLRKKSLHHAFKEFLRKYNVLNHVANIYGIRSGSLAFLRNENRISLDMNATALQKRLKNDPILLKTMLFDRYGETANYVSSLINVSDLVKDVFTNDRIKKALTLSRWFVAHLLSVCSDKCPTQVVPYLLSELKQQNYTIVYNPDDSIKVVNQEPNINLKLMAFQLLKLYADHLEEYEIKYLYNELNKNDSLLNTAIIDIFKEISASVQNKPYMDNLITLLLKSIHLPDDMFRIDILELIRYYVTDVHAKKKTPVKYKTTLKDLQHKHFRFSYMQNQGERQLFEQCENDENFSLALKSQDFLTQVKARAILAPINLENYSAQENFNFNDANMIALCKTFLANDHDGTTSKILLQYQSIITDPTCKALISSHFLKLLLKSLKSELFFLQYEIVPVLIAYAPYAENEVIPALLAIMSDPAYARSIVGNIHAGQYFNDWTYLPTNGFESAYQVLKAYAPHCPEAIVPSILTSLTKKTSALNIVGKFFNRYTEYELQKVKFYLFSLLSACAPYNFDTVTTILELLLIENVMNLDGIFNVICDTLCAYYIKKPDRIEKAISFLMSSLSTFPPETLIIYADQVLGKFAPHQAEIIIPAMKKLLESDNEKHTSTGIAFTVLKAYAASGNAEALSLLLNNDDFLNKTSDVKFIINHFIEKNPENIIFILSTLSQNMSTSQLMKPLNELFNILKSLPLLQALLEEKMNISEEHILESKKAIQKYLGCQTEKELITVLLPFLTEKELTHDQAMDKKTDELLFLVFKYRLVHEKPSGKEFYIKTILRAILEDMDPEKWLNKNTLKKSPSLERSADYQLPVVSQLFKSRETNLKEEIIINSLKKLDPF